MATGNRHDAPFRVDTAYGATIAVSSGHYLASQAAVDTFAQGGNIIDAAIVGAAVLGTVLPYACGLGGDAYLLYYDARTGATYALNGTGAAPSGALPERFATGMPSTGIKSLTVPGALALWNDALVRFGSISLKDALAPAISYAAEGFTVHLGLTENIEEKRDLIRRDAEATRIFAPERPLEIGDQFRQPDLARVLEQIAHHGVDEFYKGALAQEIVQKINDSGGLFSNGDFSGHLTLEQSPLAVTFYDHDVLTMPPNSVGLQLLLQLRALELADVANIDPDGVEFWRTTIDAWRWSVAVSKTAIGDPRDSIEPALGLLQNAADLAQPPEGVRSSVPPGSGDTSNIVLMDSDGSAVSLVQSVSSPFASGIVLPGTGIVMNNRMRGFDRIEGSVNCVRPGRRPKHTLVPVLVAKEGRVAMSVGTPGAAGQPLTLAQVLSRIIAHGAKADDAVQHPRWSVGLSNEIIVEEATPPDVLSSLRLREKDLAVMNERHVRFGSVKIVKQEGEELLAVADFRRVAAVSAYTAST